MFLRQGPNFRRRRPSVWPAVVAIVVIYLLAAAVDPCDGHSCAGNSVSTHSKEQSK